MMDLLGWKVSMAEKKRRDFSKKFVSLGVQIDFTEAIRKKIIVSSKDGGLDGIWEMIKSVAEKGGLGFKESLSLKGKMAYAEGQLFSRVAGPACRLLSRWAKDGRYKKTTEELLYVLAAGL